MVEIRTCYQTLNEVFFNIEIFRHILLSFENRRKLYRTSFTLFFRKLTKVEKVVEVRTFTVLDGNLSIQENIFQNCCIWRYLYEIGYIRTAEKTWFEFYYLNTFSKFPSKKSKCHQRGCNGMANTCHDLAKN
jgi:hypothetical protein